MTEPSVAKTTSEAQPQSRKNKPFTTERRFVAAVFFAITGALIINGAVRIYYDTYYPPAQVPAVSNCSDGIQLLFREYYTQFRTMDVANNSIALRSVRKNPELQARLTVLDQQLFGLQSLCDREGSNAQGAYRAFTLWRFQAEDLAGVQEQMLTPDAQRALNYHSPGAQNTTNLPGNHP